MSQPVRHADIQTPSWRRFDKTKDVTSGNLEDFTDTNDDSYIALHESFAAKERRRWAGSLHPTPQPGKRTRSSTPLILFPTPKHCFNIVARSLEHCLPPSSKRRRVCSDMLDVEFDKILPPVQMLAKIESLFSDCLALIPECELQKQQPRIIDALSNRHPHFDHPDFQTVDRRRYVPYTSSYVSKPTLPSTYCADVKKRTESIVQYSLMKLKNMQKHFAKETGPILSALIETARIAKLPAKSNKNFKHVCDTFEEAQDMKTTCEPNNRAFIQKFQDAIRSHSDLTSYPLLRDTFVLPKDYRVDGLSGARSDGWQDVARMRRQARMNVMMNGRAAAQRKESAQPESKLVSKVVLRAKPQTKMETQVKLNTELKTHSKSQSKPPPKPPRQVPVEYDVRGRKHSSLTENEKNAYIGLHQNVTRMTHQSSKQRSKSPMRTWCRSQGVPSARQNGERHRDGRVTSIRETDNRYGVGQLSKREYVSTLLSNDHRAFSRAHERYDAGLRPRMPRSPSPRPLKYKMAADAGRFGGSAAASTGWDISDDADDNFERSRTKNDYGFRVDMEGNSRNDGSSIRSKLRNSIKRKPPLMHGEVVIGSPHSISSNSSHEDWLGSGRRRRLFRNDSLHGMKFKEDSPIRLRDESPYRMMDESPRVVLSRDSGRKGMRVRDQPSDMFGKKRVEVVNLD